MSQTHSGSVKAGAQRLIESLPDDATWDDVMYRVYVRQCVDSGIEDADAGHVVDVEEVRRKATNEDAMDKLTSKLIEALELDRKDRWSQAHGIVQKIEDPRAYWIHAYLHRKEGDLENASYWYSRAGRSMPEIQLDEEWQAIWDAVAEEQP